jgi:GTP-binding protein HflX
LNRSGRRKVPYKLVAIVGYTNAGKSTLFNRLTGASVLAQDQVFATLDPTVREVRITPGRKVILSDTVGFISDLPTMLVAAFRATLEEVIEADLVLHVRDISHPESEAQAADVEQVLRDLGIDARLADARILEVWNKIDRVGPERREELAHAARRRNERAPVLISAVTGEGVDALLNAIDATLSRSDELMVLTLDVGAGKLMAWIYDNAEVVSRAADDAGRTTLTIRIATDKRARLEHRMRAG